MSVELVDGPAETADAVGPGTDFETLDLLADLRRPLVWPARAATVSQAVELPGLADRESAGMVLLTGLVGVLARYTGQDTVTLGLASGGLAIHVDVTGDPRFEDLLARVKTAWATPRPVTGLLGPAAVTLTDNPTTDTSPETIDIDLIATLATDGTTLRIDYAAEAFSTQWAQGLLTHTLTLTTAGLHQPEQPLSKLPLLTDTERDQLLTWGQGPTQPIPTQPIHDLVLTWAHRTPDAIAGVANDSDITYAELARRSERLAQHLRSTGVRNGDVVSLALDRSLWTLIATLAVLRAGAAYTPMDVSWPTERMRMLLADHGARIVLTTSQTAPHIPQPDGGHVIALDTDWPTIENTTPVDLPTVDPTTPAFVIYTSGSTGKPKGVVLTHTMLTNFLAWMRDECAIGPDSRMLHCCAPIFDVALGEIYTALTSGARVVVCSRDDLLDPRRLTELITTHHVTHAFCPPTNLAAIDPTNCPTLTCVTLAGEPIPPRMAHRWLATGTRLINAYGPAEASIACTWYDTKNGWPSTYVPIGWPMPNRHIRVVDPHLNLMPPGVPGEILITGHGVANGYLNRPELTTQRFVTDPHTGDIAYRTGDLARWNHTGALEILARIDHQVKINGIRIELGEIETVLEQHPDVNTAVVIRREDHGTARLIGYVTTHNGRTPTNSDLRAHAATILPPYMVPAIIMVLDRFPVGATGKIDRRALPEPGTQRPHLNTTYTPPTTNTEKLITNLFTTILNIHDIGTHDNFFDLGGTSLQAATLATALDHTTNTIVPVSQIHRTPTPHQLAHWLTTAPRRTDTSATASQSRQRSGLVPLAQQVAKCLMSPLEVINPVTWWIEGELNLRALMEALGDVHKRHEALHAQYRRVNPPVAIIPANPGTPQLLLLNDADTAQQALDQLADAVQKPLDYTKGRNWRAAVIRDKSTNRILFGVGIHHIAFDGWSHSILVRDLSHAYTARLNGQPPAWDQPAPTLRQACDEFNRLRAAADLDAQRAYWRKQLRDLPRQGQPPAGVSLEQALAWGPKDGHIVTVPPHVMERWDHAAREHRFSRSAYFAAACASALRALHQQDDIGLLMVVAKRGSRILDAAFTTRINLNCVRVRFDGPEDLGLVLRVNDTIRDLMRAQDVPFVETADDPVLGMSSEVVASLPTFVFQDNVVLPLELPGCRTEEVVEPYAREVPNGLTVEVLPRTDHALLRVTIRTDLLPYRLAEELNGHMLRFLENGPGLATTAA
jgi:amino acid adenylation domain-containing protein